MIAENLDEVHLLSATLELKLPRAGLEQANHRPASHRVTPFNT